MTSRGHRHQGSQEEKARISLVSETAYGPQKVLRAQPVLERLTERFVFERRRAVRVGGSDYPG